MLTDQLSFSSTLSSMPDSSICSSTCLHCWKYLHRLQLGQIMPTHMNARGCKEWFTQSRLSQAQHSPLLEVSIPGAASKGQHSSSTIPRIWAMSFVCCCHQQDVQKPGIKHHRFRSIYFTIRFFNQHVRSHPCTSMDLFSTACDLRH